MARINYVELPTGDAPASKGFYETAFGWRLTDFGPSYAATLVEWRKRFLESWPDITAMGFPERFRRLWNYYLCYCEAGFRAATIDVGFFVFARI